MKLARLIANYRKRAADEAEPYLNDDEAVTAWLNEAVEEATIRARLIYDTDSGFCQIPIAANNAVYALPKCMVKIASDPWLTTRHTILTGTDQSALDRGEAWPNRHHHRGWTRLWGCNWRTWTGCPRLFLQDGMRLQLVPIPTEADTLNVPIYRVPLERERLRQPDDEPVIASQWHERLIDWAMFRAFDNRDEEASNDPRAADALARFMASFGERVDAKTDRKRSERRARTTTINWP